MELPSPERISVARELHDGIAQDLVGIGYTLDLLLAEESLDNSTRSQIRRTRLEIDTLIAKVRSEILRLRRPENSTFDSRLQRLVGAQSTTLAIEFNSEVVNLSQNQEDELISVVTEILRNVERHSGASRVVINLYSVNNRTCLELTDNGIGGARMRSGHFGLQGIIERVDAMGGSFAIEEREGTRIAILI
jgi:signal transduction histidine kinase